MKDMKLKFVKTIDAEKCIYLTDRGVLRSKINARGMVSATLDGISVELSNYGLDKLCSNQVVVTFK